MNNNPCAILPRIVLACQIFSSMVTHAEQEYVAKVALGFYSEHDIDAVERDDNFIASMKDAIGKASRAMQDQNGQLEWKTSGDNVSFDKDSKSLVFQAHGTDPALCMHYANTVAAHLLSNLDSRLNVRVYFKLPCSPWGPTGGAVPFVRDKNTGRDAQETSYPDKIASSNIVDSTNTPQVIELLEQAKIALKEGSGTVKLELEIEHEIREITEGEKALLWSYLNNEVKSEAPAFENALSVGLLVFSNKMAGLMHDRLNYLAESQQHAKDGDGTFSDAYCLIVDTFARSHGLDQKLLDEHMHRHPAYAGNLDTLRQSVEASASKGWQLGSGDLSGLDVYLSLKQWNVSIQGLYGALAQSPGNEIEETGSRVQARAALLFDGGHSEAEMLKMLSREFPDADRGILESAVNEQVMLKKILPALREKQSRRANKSTDGKNLGHQDQP